MHLFVDVSNNNAHVDFPAVKKAGAVAVYLKVTEGTGFVDPDYVANRKAAKAAGLRVGGYHFGHPSNSGAQEADFFLSHLILEPGDLLPCLDIEVADGKNGVMVHAYAQGFVARVKAKTGEWPARYGGSYFFKANAIDTLPGPAWIASYGASPASKWDAWQFTDGQACYPGSICNLDTSRTPNIMLLVYKAPAHKKAAARAARTAAVAPIKTKAAAKKASAAPAAYWRAVQAFWKRHRVVRKAKP